MEKNTGECEGKLKGCESDLLENEMDKKVLCVYQLCILINSRE